MKAKKYCILAVAIILICVGGCKGKKMDKVKSTDVTLEQLNELFGQGSQATSLQRQEAFKKYKGKRVQWKGVLKSASYYGGELCASFDHQLEPTGQGSSTSRSKYGPGPSLQIEVGVQFPASQKDKLLGIQKGSFVTYQGQLNEHTGLYERPWELTDGRIVSIEP